MLPPGQEVGVDGPGDGPNLAAQQAQGSAMDLFQVAPLQVLLGSLSPGGEAAVGDFAHLDPPVQRIRQPRRGEVVASPNSFQGDRANVPQEAS